MEDMDPNQSTAFMLAAYGLVYLIAGLVPERYRAPIILIPLTISAVCVINNFSVKVRF
jgi:hypothetical protein